MRPTPIALTVEEAVNAAGISRSALYLAMKRGDLIARKAGRRTLITYADLEAYIANLPSFTGKE